MQTKASCAGRGHPARALRRPKVCRGQRGAHSRGLKRQQGGRANRRLALPPLGGELSPDGGGLVTLCNGEVGWGPKWPLDLATYGGFIVDSESCQCSCEKPD